MQHAEIRDIVGFLRVAKSEGVRIEPSRALNAGVVEVSVGEVSKILSVDATAQTLLVDTAVRDHGPRSDLIVPTEVGLVAAVHFEVVRDVII